MAKAILIKRGTQGEAIKNAVLKANEPALAWNADKSKVELWAGTGENDGMGKVLLNPDVTSEIAQVLTDAKAYTDTKITDLIDGAPETADTLKELADAIKANKDVADAITEAIGKKLDKPATDGTEGQVLKRGADGKPTWEDETDTTYGEATTSAAGLMSASDKTKLEGIADGAEANVQADWNESDTTSDAFIANKPTLGAAAEKGVATTVDTSNDLVTSGAVNTALGDKVDKVTGKQLSTEDYTSAEKTKLAGISATTGDTQTVTQADKDKWNSDVIDGGTY